MSWMRNTGCGPVCSSCPNLGFVCGLGPHPTPLTYLSDLPGLASQKKVSQSKIVMSPGFCFEEPASEIEPTFRGLSDICSYDHVRAPDSALVSTVTGFP